MKLAERLRAAVAALRLRHRERPADADLLLRGERAQAGREHRRSAQARRRRALCGQDRRAQSRHGGGHGGDAVRVSADLVHALASLTALRSREPLLLATTKRRKGEFHAPYRHARAHRARGFHHLCAGRDAGAPPQQQQQPFRKLELFAHRTVGSRGDRQRREGQPLRADARHRVGRSEAGRAEIPAARRQRDDDPAGARGGVQIHREEAARRHGDHRGGRGEQAARRNRRAGPRRHPLQRRADERDALLATKHLDIRTEDATVRLSFAGLDEAQPASSNASRISARRRRAGAMPSSSRSSSK